MSPIDAAFSRSRTVGLVFVLLLVAGAVAWRTIPKEAAPDVPIPYAFVSVIHEGIAPEDAERLLVRPLETELQALEGLKEMRATAGQGYATIALEFDAGYDTDKALREVREKVDNAAPELPPDSREPRVTEINISLFPVLTAALSGQVPERTLLQTARDLRDRIEALPGVLEVDIGGDREEVLEVQLKPSVLENYDLSFDEVIGQLQRNNRLVAAGSLDAERGRYTLKVPGVIEDRRDVMTLPIKVENGRVVTFGDVADIRRTFKEADSLARINGAPAVALEVKKRTGANVIDTVAAVRAIIAEQRVNWNDQIQVTYLQDNAEDIRQMLGDLQNNVLTAIVLVMIVIVAALGPRPSLLVGLAIPGSFLTGVLVISWLGYTLNIVVLFSLILVVGMLVDGAIVTIELADRRLKAGVAPAAAYASASKRMAWPIIASTATTLAVFVPMLFWPGMVGEFMKFLPVTVIATLTASLLMALIFVPVLGGSLLRRGQGTQGSAVPEDIDDREAVNENDPYYRLLDRILDHPGKLIAGVTLILVAAYAGYAFYGTGVTFFPEVEPEYAQLQVRARGDLSLDERDDIVRSVERRLAGVEGVESIYGRTLADQYQGYQDMPADVIGVIQLDFVHWRERPPAEAIISTLRARTADMPGILVQVREQQHGPSQGKPVRVELTARQYDSLEPAVRTVRNTMAELGGFVDVEDSRPLPGVEWALKVDRERAARFGADVTLLGQAVQLITNGIQLGEYRPNDADEEVDIRVRYPRDERNLDRLTGLRVPTRTGLVPITNFVTFEPQPRTGTLNRVDGRRVMTVAADVAPDRLVSEQVNRLRAALDEENVSDSVQVRFKGESEDQQAAAAFLSKAFIAAVLLMLAVLVTQFNNFYQAFIILSAIVFATAGVLLGLLATGRPFGVVMSGVGVIALAGIVVNNNIVLIDTYNQHLRSGLDKRMAILKTAMQRRRPVLLTSITTILGLLPMVLKINVDLVRGDIAYGAPSTQWWTELSTSIAGGLLFATLLTLFLTPCFLMLGRKRVNSAG